MELQYTGENITKHFGQPYILSNPDELNILVDAMEKTWPPLHNLSHQLSSPPQRF